MPQQKQHKPGSLRKVSWLFFWGGGLGFASLCIRISRNIGRWRDGLGRVSPLGRIWKEKKIKKNEKRRGILPFWYVAERSSDASVPRVREVGVGALASVVSHDNMNG